MVLIHEVGHIVGLNHPMEGSYPIDAPSCDCIDTPHWTATTLPNDSNLWNVCNNLMQTNPHENQISPCQLGIMHYYSMQNLLPANILLAHDIISNSPLPWDNNSPIINKGYCDYHADETMTIQPDGLDHTWKSDRDLLGDLVIESGATLTIAAHTGGSQTIIGMPKGARIFVKAGGKLILDNALITNRCGEHWRGVWLDSNTQTGDVSATDQVGTIILQNNATIEYAEDGITTRRDDYVYTGGVVQATNAIFRNNLRDVEFMRARHVNDNGAPVRNPSFFSHCQFVTDDNYRNHPTGANISHVTMWDVHGIKFTNCTFSSFINDANDVRRYKTGGIQSDAATYTAIDNIFAGEYYGIAAYNAKAPAGLGQLFIQQNTFGVDNAASALQTQRGVYVSAGSAFVVDNNTFYSDNRPDNNPYNHEYDPNANDSGTYGLYLDGCLSWKGVENNEFTNLHPAPAETPFGAIVNNSEGGGIQIVRNNVFSDLAFGISPMGNNRTNSNVGLQVRCNEFNRNNYDIFVIGGGGNTGGIPNQGSGNTATSPACNRFVNSGTAVNIFSWATRTADYYYHANTPNMLPTVDPDAGPNIADEVNPQSVNRPYVKADACPITVFTPPSIMPSNPAQKMAAAWLTRSDALVTKGILQNQLAQLKDGGNTTLLENEVVTAQLQAAWDLYVNLMAKSPYLSDEVLTALAEKEDFPAVLLKNVLLANQHAAKNAEIIATLENRSNVLPDYMLTIIKNSGSNSNAKETLERAIDAQQIRFAEAIEQQLAVLYADSTATAGSFTAVLQGTDIAEYRLQYAERLIEAGNYSAATGVAENLATDCALSEKQVARYAAHNTLIAVIAALKAAGKTWANLDATQKATLQSIAGNDNYAAAYARGILRVANGGDTLYREPMPHLPNTMQQRNKLKVKKLGANTTLSELTVSPNPAQNYLTIHYNLVVPTATLQVIDALGRVVFTTSFTNGINDIVVPTANWSAEAYRVVLRIDAKIIATKSILITK